MTIKNVTLYAYPTSPYANKVSCFLSYKGVDFKFVPVNPITTNEIKFTNQRVIPVLQMDDEWRVDSTPIGLWLDECFTDRPMLGEDDVQRALILSIDDWVTQQVIPYQFHKIVHWTSISRGLRQGWALSKVVNASTPLPAWVKVLWPVLLKRASFIVAMVNPQDAKKTQAQLQSRLLDEFKVHLAHGPFLGSNTQVSLADLSLYSVISADERLSIAGPINQFYDAPVVIKWSDNVKKTLSNKPLLIDYLQY